MNEVICFGEILLRLKAPNFERLLQNNMLECSFCGGEVNVAVSLSLFGVKSSIVTVLPDNRIGKAADMELAKYRVDTSNVKFTKGRMGTYYLEAGVAQRASQVIYDRDYSAFSLLEEGSFDWCHILNGAKWFHVSGITPAISRTAANETIKAVKAAKKLGLTVSCDLNYRSKLWNYGKSAFEVMPEIVKYADVVIGNEEDCQKALGIVSSASPESGTLEMEMYKDITEKLLSAYPNVKTVSITLRESKSANHNVWSGCLNDRNNFYASKKYDIDNIVDRVGGGDSFSAGLIYGLYNGMPSCDVLEFAVAASCLKHSIYGDFNLITVDEVKKLVNGNASGRIVR